jgi:GNAT superfamily N-acetyltransferase
VAIVIDFEFPEGSNASRCEGENRVQERRENNRMSIYKLENTAYVKELFAESNETILLSCLQQVMGSIYVKDRNSPKSAIAILGDFAFYAGKPDRELVSYKPERNRKDFIIMVPLHTDWEAVIEECYKVRARRITRYAMKKEPDVFDQGKLQKIASSLKKEYSLKLLDREAFEYVKAHDWCKDLCSQYETYESYQKNGLGVVIYKNGEIVAGASSYSSYLSGIEIEIDTREDERRKGLASACGASLILECLKRGLYPSWDAQNLWSVALAEKLGYHFDHEYTAYEIYPW